MSSPFKIHLNWGINISPFHIQRLTTFMISSVFLHVQLHQQVMINHRKTKPNKVETGDRALTTQRVFVWWESYSFLPLNSNLNINCSLSTFKGSLRQKMNPVV